jgi:hypothetical protein
MTQIKSPSAQTISQLLKQNHQPLN